MEGLQKIFQSTWEAKLHKDHGTREGEGNKMRNYREYKTNFIQMEFYLTNVEKHKAQAGSNQT